MVRDWVDVPLVRLEQYQRHIDPVPVNPDRGPFRRLSGATCQGHEMAQAGTWVAGAEMHVVHSGPSPPDLVPFWKPPNISDRMISTTITSSTNSRHPPARDRGQRRRGPLDLYIRMGMPRHSAICRPCRII